MGLYSAFQDFDTEGVIHETGSSEDVHRLTLCCKGWLYNVFRFFFRRRGVISVLVGYNFTLPPDKHDKYLPPSFGQKDKCDTAYWLCTGKGTN